MLMRSPSTFHGSNRKCTPMSVVVTVKRNVPWALSLTSSSLRQSTFSSSCLFFCSTFCRYSVRDLILASCWRRKTNKQTKKLLTHTILLRMKKWFSQPAVCSSIPGRCEADRQPAPSRSRPSSCCSPTGCSPAVCSVSPWSSLLTSSYWCRGGPLWTPRLSSHCHSRVAARTEKEGTLRIRKEEERTRGPFNLIIINSHQLFKELNIWYTQDS